VVVDLAVGGFTVRLGFECNAVTFSSDAFGGHTQPLWHSRADTFDQLGELCLGLRTSQREFVWLAHHRPCGIVTHHRQGLFHLARRKVLKEADNDFFVVFCTHWTPPVPVVLHDARLEFISSLYSALLSGSKGLGVSRRGIRRRGERGSLKELFSFPRFPVPPFRLRFLPTIWR